MLRYSVFNVGLLGPPVFWFFCPPLVTAKSKHHNAIMDGVCAAHEPFSIFLGGAL